MPSAATVAPVVVRLGIAAALLVIAAVVAWVMDRRRREIPAPFRSAADLHQVRRDDFARPDAPWLVLLFTSRDCAGCEPMTARIAPLESSTVAVAVCEYHDDKALHQRYEIDGVPYLVMADAEGVVRASFLGTVSTDELWTRVNALVDGS